MSLIFFILIITILGFILYKKSQNSSINISEQQLLNQYKENISSEINNFATNFYQNYKSNTIEQIQEKTTTNYFNQIKNLIINKENIDNINIVYLKCELDTVIKEDGFIIAYVRIISNVNEKNENNINKMQSVDLWKLKLVNNNWKLDSVRNLSSQSENTIINENEKVIEFNSSNKYDI